MYKHNTDIFSDKFQNGGKLMVGWLDC